MMPLTADQVRALGKDPKERGPNSSRTATGVLGDDSHVGTLNFSQTSILPQPPVQGSICGRKDT